MDAKDFRKLIRRTLLEEVEKRSSTGEETTYYDRVPEVVHGEDYKNITPHKRDERTKEEILDDILKVAKAADSSATVVWDDNDDISVSARDLFRARITPRWENSYNVEVMIRNEDRIYITNQTLDQVVSFLKVNLKNATTRTQKAYDKSVKNGMEKNDQTKAPDKGLSQENKPKIYPLTNEPPKTAKNSEKRYTETMTKEEKDYPEKPMRELTGGKLQRDHKADNPKTLMKEKTKYPEKKPNTTLTLKIGKQETSKHKTT